MIPDYDIETEFLLTLKHIAIIDMNLSDKVFDDYEEYKIPRCFKNVSERFIKFFDDYKAQYNTLMHIHISVKRILEFSRHEIEKPLLDFFELEIKNGRSIPIEAIHAKTLVFAS